ncbi:hypothetical protein G6F46_014473 [Rhizopus delemar]|nr:hypothetical protein G6F46_014473 [Rhizopus delemar]
MRTRYAATACTARTGAGRWGFSEGRDGGCGGTTPAPGTAASPRSPQSQPSAPAHAAAQRATARAAREARTPATPSPRAGRRRTASPVRGAGTRPAAACRRWHTGTRCWPPAHG